MKLGKFIGIVLIALLLITPPLNAGEFKLGSGGSVKVGSGGNIILSTPSWVPTDIPGCVLWLRSDFAWQDAAKTIRCTNNSLIWTGEDKSGRGNDAVQATEAKRFIYKTNQINGHPSWRSAGVDDMMSGMFPFNTDQIHVFIVAKRVAVEVTGASMIFLNAGQPNDYGDPGSFILDYQGGAGADLMTYRNGALSTATHPGDGVLYLFETKFDGTNNTTYLNGTAKPSVASAGNFSIDDYYLAIRWEGGVPSRFISNDFVEIIAYAPALSDTNRQRVELYLNTEAQGNGYAIY